MLGLLVSLAFAAPSHDLIDLRKIDASISTELRYAHERNPLKRAIYSDPICVLRKPVAMALSRVQSNLRIQGYGLRVLDCYRPSSLNEISHSLNPIYSRGATLDAILVDRDGNAVEMPSVYGEKKSAKTQPAARRNAARLARAMELEGFSKGVDWWQYTLSKIPPASSKEFDLPLSDFR